jgi:hypothetical protein
MPGDLPAPGWPGAAHDPAHATFPVTMKNKSLLLCAALMAFPLFVVAQSPVDDPEVKAIEAKYGPKWTEIAARGDDLEKRAPRTQITGAGEIRMEEKIWKLDIPEVAMRLQEFSFDVPEVRMARRSFKWDVPEMRMARRRGPDIPEAVTDFSKIPPRVTVRMKPTYYDFPETVMVTKEASFDFPEVVMKRRDIKMDLPDVRMKTHTWRFNLPVLVIHNISVEKKKFDEDADRLGRDATELAAAQENEIGAVVLRRLVAQRVTVSNSFSEAQTSVGKAIDESQKAGLNPSAIPQENGLKLDLFFLRADLEKQGIAALAAIDVEIDKLKKKAA